MQLTQKKIEQYVRAALTEDIGTKDVTVLIIPKNHLIKADIVAKEPGILAGAPFAAAAFHLLDPSIDLVWHKKEADHFVKDDILLSVQGKARAVLTAERTALNFLQLLSGVATETFKFSRCIAHTSAKILDTRKTLPLLREAQKYAVKIGGGYNHRFGLYDRFLIKENHIHAAGGITAALIQAKKLNKNDLIIEIEVENLTQFEEAVALQPHIIMLDNFSVAEVKIAVSRRIPPILLEASGNMTLNNIAAFAETGVDFISIGSITKNVQAIDLSMRYTQSN